MCLSLIAAFEISLSQLYFLKITKLKGSPYYYVIISGDYLMVAMQTF